MTSLFPTIRDEAHFSELFDVEANWRPGIEAILAAESITYTTLERAPVGSNIVYWVDADRVFKACPPLPEEDAEVELAILSAIAPEHEALLAPKLLAHGEHEGWRYMLMSRVRGSAANTVWPTLDAASRAQILQELFTWMARFASSRAQQVTLPEARRDWEATQTTLREELGAKHLRRGADPQWRDELERAFADFLPRPAARIIHADLHLGNLLVHREHDAAPWHLSGVIDFADALMAPEVYDYGAIIASLTGGDPHLMAQVRDALPAFTARQLTQWLLLHRFASIAHYLRRPALAGSADFETFHTRLHHGRSAVT